MKKVLIPIADGSEEMEAVIMIDILRRADIDVTLASIMKDRTVTASRGVEIVADCLIGFCQNKHWDMVAIPGGMPGAQRLADDRVLKDIIADQIKADRWLAAICASPALVLAANGFIAGASATCYPAFRHVLETHRVHAMNDSVCLYNHLITSQGPGTAISFALELVAVLVGDVKAVEIAEALCFKWER